MKIKTHNNITSKQKNRKEKRKHNKETQGSGTIEFQS
jgi:hypothetical protein